MTGFDHHPLISGFSVDGGDIPMSSFHATFPSFSIQFYILFFLYNLPGKNTRKEFKYRNQSRQNLAHSALSLFKFALKMLSRFASQLDLSENGSCLPRTAVMALFTF